MGEHRALRRRIGYLPQGFGYYKRFTVREFVEYMAGLKEVPKADIPAAVQRAVERVGPADRAEEKRRRPRAMSRPRRWARRRAAADVAAARPTAWIAVRTPGVRSPYGV